MNGIIIIRTLDFSKKFWYNIIRKKKKGKNKMTFDANEILKQLESGTDVNDIAAAAANATMILISTLLSPAPQTRRARPAIRTSRRACRA